jgi:hypothetical protein
LSVAEPLGVTRLNADAGNGIAYLAVVAQRTVLVFQRALCRRPVQIRLMDLFAPVRQLEMKALLRL